MILKKTLLALAVTLSLGVMTASPAFAGGGAALRASDLPAPLSYHGSGASASRAKGLGVHHSLHYGYRGPQRLVEAPSRYRTKSILRYSKELGDSGLVLRIKAPMKPRSIVRLELRF